MVVPNSGTPGADFLLRSYAKRRAGRVCRGCQRSLGSTRTVGSVVVLEAERRAEGHQMFDMASLAEVVCLGPAGEATLINLLRTDAQPAFISALGEAEGEDGVAVLRSVIIAPVSSTDERCAALVALSKRQ